MASLYSSFHGQKFKISRDEIETLALKRAQARFGYLCQIVDGRSPIGTDSLMVAKLLFEDCVAEVECENLDEAALAEYLGPVPVTGMIPPVRPNHLKAVAPKQFKCTDPDNPGCQVTVPHKHPLLP